MTGDSLDNHQVAVSDRKSMLTVTKRVCERYELKYWRPKKNTSTLAADGKNGG